MRVRLNVARLQEILASSRLSQNHWASRVGVSRGHWSDIVNGRHPYPSAATRQRMLEALGVPMEELFSIESGPRATGPVPAATITGPQTSAVEPAVRTAETSRRVGTDRANRTGGALSHLGQDARLAWRSLRRDWRFALAFAIPLALGLGAGGSFYAIVDQVVFRRPPHVSRPDELVRLAIATDRFPDPFTTGSVGASWVDYDLLARQATTFAGVAAYTIFRPSLGSGESARTIPVMLATASWFNVLGVRPQVGRFYAPDEDRESASIVPCVASDRFWRVDLGGGSDALGRDLQVGNLRCQVVGVTPPGFNGTGLNPIDLYLPMRASGEAFFGDATLWTSASSHWMSLIARPRPGVAKARLDFDATRAYQSFTTRVRDPGMKFSMVSGPLFDASGAIASARIRTALWLVGGAGALLLLVGANLVNLLVARNLGRLRETAIRLALGGSRARLFVRYLVECAILAAIAGAGALLVVNWVGPVARTVLYPGANWVEGPVTVRVVALAVGLSLLIGGLIATVTTLHATRVDPAVLLAAGGGGRTTGSRGSHRIRLGLVAAQAALSVALLVASAGFVRSFNHAANSSLGFDIDGLVFAEVQNLESIAPARDDQRAFYLEVRDRLAALPGVASVSLGYNTPWRNNRSETVRIPGRDSLPPVPNFRVPVFDAVTPDYLETMRLGLRAGRWLDASDGPGSATVLVVSASLANLYWGDALRALGNCMFIGESPACREVVGVVDDMRFTGGLQDAHVPLYYLPLAQATEYSAPPKLFIRVRGDASAMVPVLRRAVQGARPGVPAAAVQPMQALLDPLLSSWRLGAVAFSALGILAAVIAMLGLFSVLAWLVTERRREFAIRSALGGAGAQIVAPVVRQAIVVVGAGSAIGVLLAMRSAPWLQPQLFEVELLDPVVIGAVVAALVAVAVLAVAGPVRRAATLDPVEALRAD